ncbi:MAG: DUF3857 domain-containing protein [Bacteroidetes bacterium]|nr:DUF3857 domain-containing protein [Bacteroidota bacterium]
MKNLLVSKFAYCTLFLFIVFFASAQKAPMKYGKVDDSLINMQKFEADTSANAVILGDYGVVEIKYESEGWTAFFTRHLRVKIFNRDAFDLANFRIGLRNSAYGGERFSKLQATVFNLEDGKITKTKFNRKSTFEEVVSNYYKYVIFTLPNIREGSVFDLEYTIVIPTNFLGSLPDWYFQSEYPTVLSEFRTNIPEYFSYKTLMHGYVVLKSREVNTHKNSKFNYLDTYTRYLAENVPAFKTEPHMNSLVNYISRLEHEIAAYKAPYGGTTDYSNSWPKINKELMESDDFGKQLQRSGFLKNEVEKIKAENETSIDRMIAAHKLIQSEMVWTERNSIYISSTLRKAWQEKKGNAADINMMLVLLLSELEIDAHPVILSTRRNGIINPIQLMLSKYNYVVAYAEIDGKGYVMDATEKRIPYFLLPERCLNGQGRLISETRSRWVNLDAVSSNLMHTESLISVKPCGSLSIALTRNLDNYFRLNMTEGYRKYDSEEEYMDSFEAANQGIVLNSFVMENQDDWGSPLISKYEFDIPDADSNPKDIIYFNPFTIDKLESNPFRLEERLYPVDFVYPRKRTYSIRVELPEGYIVEELPRDSRVTLPQRGGSFSCRYKKTEAAIELTVEIDLRKAIYLSEEYQTLKEFYAKIVEEQARQIVLKKI